MHHSSVLHEFHQANTQNPQQHSSNSVESKSTNQSNHCNLTKLQTHTPQTAEPLNMSAYECIPQPHSQCNTHGKQPQETSQASTHNQPDTTLNTTHTTHSSQPPPMSQLGEVIHHYKTITTKLMLLYLQASIKSSCGQSESNTN
eukprot:gene3412-2363_t